MSETNRALAAALIPVPTTVTAGFAQREGIRLPAYSDQAALRASTVALARGFRRIGP